MAGYTFAIPCYIASARIIKEGGYEAESPLICRGLTMMRDGLA